MVVKMMSWRPWPPLATKKYQVKLVLRKLEGLVLSEEEPPRLMVELKWKGQKAAGLTALRRKVKRNFTAEKKVVLVQEEMGAVEWEEEFVNECGLSFYKGNSFHPWEIGFTVFNVSSQTPKNKFSIVGTCSVNLGAYASSEQEKEVELTLPLCLPRGSSQSHSQPSLKFVLSFLELRTTTEAPEAIPRLGSTPSPQSGEVQLPDKEELSALKASLRKVKLFTDYVSVRRMKKVEREDEASDERYSGPSDDTEGGAYAFETDSPEDLDERGAPLTGDSSFRKSFSYGTLASTNDIGRLYYSEMRINDTNEDMVYYSNRRSDVGNLHVEESTSASMDDSYLQASKRRILPWRKRKLNFRSPKTKGEPLLKKAYAEEGGDDIDYDRRQLSSSDESFALMWNNGEAMQGSSASEFGDDCFAVGCWEKKEVVSRDGHMKLSTEVFFASIDQRSERAAGESACTALVAVIADWFQNNKDMMPIKSQFDSLIREGSLEWRNLCENTIYMERFPDKHFDLETVIEAKIRPLTVAPGKSYVGFFHPEEINDDFDFLQGAMSFDSIWEEISGSTSEESQLFVVSWNDHFFVLKVDRDACYIVDTLGERLFEGCNQAYILKFNDDTVIHKIHDDSKVEEKESSSKPEEMQNAKTDDKKSTKSEDNKLNTKCDEKQQSTKSSGKQIGNTDEGQTDDLKTNVIDDSNQQADDSTANLTKLDVVDKDKLKDDDGEVVCSGRESCKEYIKKFLAAIPLRELENDIKKGRSTAPLHHRLQIEFHYTEILPSPSTDLTVS